MPERNANSSTAATVTSPSPVPTVEGAGGEGQESAARLPLTGGVGVGGRGNPGTGGESPAPTQLTLDDLIAGVDADLVGFPVRIHGYRKEIPAAVDWEPATAVYVLHLSGEHVANNFTPVEFACPEGWETSASASGTIFFDRPDKCLILCDDAVRRDLVKIAAVSPLPLSTVSANAVDGSKFVPMGEGAPVDDALATHYTVHLACRDERGNNNYFLAAVNLVSADPEIFDIAVELEAECDRADCPRIHIAGGVLNIAGHSFPIAGHATHVGNLMWDTVTVDGRTLISLVNHLQSLIVFECTAAWASLSDSWGKGQFGVNDLDELRGAVPVERTAHGRE